ncbi:hypothetical protein [Flavobacterium columnare]|uniref:hypothetical protein n=1 Tax=Flavobacterium columnare TaxID=996 RepID=UPI003B9FCF30
MGTESISVLTVVLRNALRKSERSGMKKNGVLHLFDGQTGEYVIFSQTDRKYANFIQRGYKEFQFLKVR